MSSITTSPLIESKENVPKAFNTIATKYDFATSMSQGYQSDLNQSCSLLNLKGHELVLDLCCGTGKSTKPLIEALSTGKVLGIDNSEGMLAVANRKYKQEVVDGRIEFQLHDAMKLPYHQDSFDAIFMAYGLRNMPDYEVCLSQIFKLLKPGGRLVIHDYSLANKWYAKAYWGILGYGFIVPFCTIVSGSSRIYRYLIKSVFRFMRPDEGKKMLESQGFINVRVHPLKGWRSVILHSFYAEKKK